MAKGCKVRVTRLDTGETFPTIKAAAQAMFISPAYLAVARHRKQKKACGIPIRFEETSDHARARKIRNLNTGEIFDSVKEAAEAYGVCPETVRESAMSCHRARGCRWRYV